MEVVLIADVEPFEGRLHHRLGRVAVAADDAVAERAVVNTDSQRRAVSPANLEQRFGPQRHTLDLRGIFAVGEVELREVTLVGEVAGVHADFVHERRHRLRHLGVEMHVGDERYMPVTV